MRRIIILTLWWMGILTGLALIGQTEIDKNKERFKTGYQDVSPREKVQYWVLPFKTLSRHSLKSVRIISLFGAKRYSYVRGHIHTGIDLVTVRRNKFTYVYPMGPGKVCSIHLGDPHRTIVIKHMAETGTVLYTSYKHLKEIDVEVGDGVNINTRLARLYTRKEALALGGNYDHLHLEIRKKFDDYGVASWATMTKKELNLRFYDPHIFLKKYLKKSIR